MMGPSLRFFFFFSCFDFMMSVAWNPTSCGPTDQMTEWGNNVNSSSVLPEYPRPQLVRNNTWRNMNGLWQFNGSSEPNTAHPLPYTSLTFDKQILVPFPAESCLSGIGLTFTHLQYRIMFDDFENRDSSATRVLLHFGAIDWQSDIYINGVSAGTHSGGYDAFALDISTQLEGVGNELFVSVYDPSDEGAQPNGKQRISAIAKPGGDTYTPSSGIWQTVWLEVVPADTYITDYKLSPTLDSVSVNVSVFGDANASVTLTVIDPSTNDEVAVAQGVAHQLVTLKIPNPKLWDPTEKSPFLYNLRMALSDSADSAMAYFGLRTVELGHFEHNQQNVSRLLLNGKPIFLAGWLDQSFWPDGLYTAPSDEALQFDVQSVLNYGLNAVRVHQKVNPERWYYYADKLGVIVLQDMVQKYGHASNATIAPFMSDLTAMIDGKFNHPSIVQWTAFNEGDCWEVFNNQSDVSVEDVVNYIKKMDPTRLIDTDSGGAANDLKLADVNDVHSYPYPRDPKPSGSQYAMVGEYGGIGYFAKGKEWVQNGCYAYKPVSTSQEFAQLYINMTETILDYQPDLSVVIYTQITDVETECDGYLNYDRTAKWTEQQIESVFYVNQKMIQSAYLMN